MRAALAKRDGVLDSFEVIGAGNRVRTGGLDLGKVALYQLSYTRFRKALT